jgi:hypothetical protein
MLTQMIEKHFPQVQLLSFPRKNFDDKDGKNMVGSKRFVQ